MLHLLTGVFSCMSLSCLNWVSLRRHTSNRELSYNQIPSDTCSQNFPSNNLYFLISTLHHLQPPTVLLVSLFPSSIASEWDLGRQGLFSIVLSLCCLLVIEAWSRVNECMDHEWLTRANWLLTLVSVKGQRKLVCLGEKAEQTSEEGTQELLSDVLLGPSLGYLCH